jgi:DNA polymerase-3 subunit delta'
MAEYWNGTYGQDLVKNLLGKLIESGKVPHALLFTGIEGTGKDFFAIRFAQALIKVSDAPEKDTIINQIGNLCEPYFKYIIPLPRGKNETDESGPVDKLSNEEIQVLRDELNRKINNPYYNIKIPKANNIKISSIRDIKRFVSFNYDDIPYRVIVISDAHLMNEEAQNALLKSLEEPPEGVIFILTTPYPGILRETIRSRCWGVNFQPLSDDDVQNILVKNFNFDNELAETIAPFAMGSAVNALNLNEHEFAKLLDKTIFLLRYSFGRRYHSALNEILPYVTEGGADSVKLLIQMIIIWLNDLQKLRYKENNIFFKSHLETLEKFNVRFPDLQLNETVVKLDKFSSLIAGNINLNLIALNIVIELASLTIRPKK